MGRQWHWDLSLLDEGSAGCGSVAGGDWGVVVHVWGQSGTRGGAGEHVGRTVTSRLSQLV